MEIAPHCTIVNGILEICLTPRSSFRRNYHRHFRLHAFTSYGSQPLGVVLEVHKNNYVNPAKCGYEVL